MRILAILFFSIAALLSAALVPNSYTLLPLLSLSVPRALALALALIFWIAAGHLDSWGSSRLLQSLVAMLCVAALCGGCLFIQVMRDDILPAPLPIVYRVALALFPACLMIGAFVPSRKLFLATAVLALVAGIVAASSAEPLSKIYYAGLPISKENRDNAALLARRMSELEKVPGNAGLEPLLAFVNPSEPYDVREKAQARIEQVPDWIPQVSNMLEGGNRQSALYVLTRHVDLLAPPLLDRCWAAAAAIAKGETNHSESSDEMLLNSVVALGSKSSREQHAVEMATVRTFLLAGSAPPNTAILDFWVRQSQLHRIPESAGIVPLLEFVGPGQGSEVDKEARARIEKVPDSTSKLAKLLAGPHRLDAVMILSGRVEQLPQDLREQTWQAAALTAKEMAKDIERHHPPRGFEVNKLVTAAGLLWPKLGPIQEQRLADLSMMRDVLRAAGDSWDKGALGWADGVIAQQPG